MNNRKVDCLVIGAGPGGLLAALYLCRFRRRIIVMDGGQSRCSLIPRSNNVPGFPSGITGVGLLENMRDQLNRLGLLVEKSTVDHLECTEFGFRARYADGKTIDTTTVILATGIVDIHPDMAGWRDALAQGDLRYCPICDGYEAIGRSIAVIGSAKHAARKAIFLRTYSEHVAALRVGPHEDSSEDDRQAMSNAGIRTHASYVVRLKKAGESLIAVLADGDELRFDIVYPAMGAQVRSELATLLGAQHDRAGFLRVDGSQETTVKGVYAVGDVVCDLHQISVAFGHAAVAACRIHNCLDRNPA